MMKYIFLLAFISLSVNVYAQEPDCNRFKNGKFKIVDKETGKEHFITRKGSKQIEYNEELGLKIAYRVTWINECTYTIQKRKILENPNNLPYPEGHILTVKILSTEENSYFQRSSSNMFDKIMECEVARID